MRFHTILWEGVVALGFLRGDQRHIIRCNEFQTILTAHHNLIVQSQESEE